MTSVCYTCRYSAEGMQYCGKGLLTRVTACSGYVEGLPAAPHWTIYPGCDFPVSSTNYFQGGPVYVFTIEYGHNPAMAYLVGTKPWSMSTVGKWKVYMDHYQHRGSRVMLVGHKAKVPASLWWLDPRLAHSNEQVVPMYALLVTVSTLTPPSRISEGCRKVHPSRQRVLNEALQIGLRCQGRPIEDWALAIKEGPASHWMSRLLGIASNYSGLWGEVMYQQWVSTIDAMYNVVGGQYAM